MNKPHAAYVKSTNSFKSGWAVWPSRERRYTNVPHVIGAPSVASALIEYNLFIVAKELLNHERPNRFSNSNE